MNKNTISAEEFDRLFDEGREDITKFFDLKAARRLSGEIKAQALFEEPGLFKARKGEPEPAALTPRSSSCG